MKIARLSTGTMLKFPDDTPDSAIDETVRVHLKDHIAKNQEAKQREEKNQADGEMRHKDLMQALEVIARLHHEHLQKTQSLLEHGIRGHQEIMDGLKQIARPRKRKAIRDSKGKLIGAEEY